jgi:HEXXH motif-containing protein
MVNGELKQFVALFGRSIGPLQSGPKNVHLSVSFQSLPNAVFLSFNDDPLVIAEALVHEADHNFLYALDRCRPIWCDGDEAYDAKYWSPWRQDLRPLDGILRGASAFVSVSELLSDIFGATSLPAELRDKALQRAIFCSQQVGGASSS